jgi:hypothetical protein
MNIIESIRVQPVVCASRECTSCRWVVERVHHRESNAPARQKRRSATLTQTTARSVCCLRRRCSRLAIHASL